MKRYNRSRAPRPPMALAMRYQKILRTYLDRLQARILELVTAGWESNRNHASGTIQDASSWVNRRIQNVQILVEENFNPQELAGELDTLATGIDRHGLLEFKRVAGISLTRAAGLGDLLPQFRDRNVGLIKSLVGRQKEEIRDVLDQAEREAWRVEELRSEIQNRFDVSKSKADLLARDQVLKLNGQIAQARQQAAGIERYTWSTSGDERVRETHSDLDGTVQSWAAPPVISEDGRTGHPGDDYQCRCVAIPILTLLDDTEEAE